MVRYLLICLFLISGSVYSQHNEIDSLLNILKTEPDIRLKGELLNELASISLQMDPDASKSYAQKALSMGKQIKNGSVIAQAYNNLAFYAYLNGQLDSSIVFCSNGLDVAEASNDISLIANLSSLLGAMFLNQGDTDKAIDPIFYAIKIAESNGLKEPLIRCYNTAGELYQFTADYEKSKIYYKKALDVLRSSTKDKSKEVMLLSNIARVSNVKLEKIEILKEAIEIGEKYELNRSLGYAYSSLADMYMNTQDSIHKAISLYKNAYEIVNAIGDQKLIMHTNIYLGRALVRTNQADEASSYLKRGLDMAIQSNHQNHINEVYTSLARYYELKGDYKKAYAYKDSSMNGFFTEYNETITQLSQEANAKYQAAEKEKQLAQQELEIAKQKQHRNQILGGSIIVLLLSAGFGFAYYQRQLAKKKMAELALENERSEKEKLKELDQLKTQFFTNVSHELKTPLTLIMGPLSNVLEKVDDNTTKENVLLAYNNAEKLNTLINETLDLAKLEKGKIDVKQEPTQIGKFLVRSMMSLSSLAEMRAIKLEANINFPNDTFILCDPDKVEKILSNLVSNAIKFSDNNSTITMNAELKDHLTIQIMDQGKGIPEEEQELIFNRFYQAKHNQYGSYGGTGIGLAYSRELAELMGGSLSLESNAGNGSIFTFSIPFQEVEGIPSNEEEEKTTRVQERYQPILINGEKPRILLVEDNNEMQQYLKSLLQDEYFCDIAVDGYEALKKIQTTHYHLVSSDVMMPNMDGFTLKERINNLKDYKRVPFIFLTARSLEVDKLSGLRLGVDDYITKPFSKNEYKIRIHNLLNNHKERLSADQEFGEAENAESVDLKILKKAEKVILDNIDQPQFTVPDFAAALHYSQRQLARIIKQLTGLTPVNFILEIRLQKAFSLLKTNTYNSVSEVMYEVGIESASYFTRKFKERFGVSPSEL